MKYLTGAALALTLLGSTAAIAQRDSDHRQTENADQRQNSNDRPHWSRGDRLPDQYRQNQYVVGDWRQHNLKTPPRGYHWVRNDNDQYLLAAISSGIIQEIVGQNEYRSDYQWSRGSRLTGGYLDKRYVVANWKTSHLREPPRGYHWVHVNNQYLLTAIATGVITDVVLNVR